MNEGHCNLLGQSRQRLSQNVSHSRRFHRQSLQLAKDRRLGIRLEMNLIASLRSHEQSRIHPASQFPLSCPLPDPSGSHDLTQVKRLLRTDIKQRQQSALRLVEQCRADR